MKITRYAGYVMDDGRVNVIVKKGDEYHRIPHIESMEEGVALTPIKLNMESEEVTKHGLRYLTQHEVASFMRGENTDGSRAKPPSEFIAEANASMREFLKTKEGKEFVQKMKAEAEKNPQMREMYEFCKELYNIENRLSCC